MANEPNLKAINLESDFPVGIKALNFEIENISLALKCINLETTYGTQFMSNTSLKSNTTINS